MDPGHHADALFDAFALDQEGGDWTYLPYGPFPDLDGFRRCLDGVAGEPDPLFFTISHAASAPLGLLSLLRINYEGTHRQAVVYKGRNRDTAWYSIIDSEWPGVRCALEEWLAPENFDADGNQVTPLRVHG